MIELSAKTTCCPLSLDLHQIKMLEGSGFDLGVFKKICKGHHFGSGTADAEGWNIYWLEGGQGQEAEAGKGKETIAQLNAGPLFSNLILLRLRHGKEFKEPSVRARRVEANGGELVVWRFRGAEVVTAQLLGDRLDLPGRDACTYISTKAATSAFSLRW